MGPPAHPGNGFPVAFRRRPVLTKGMLARDPDVIFVHLRKSAGTSVMAMFDVVDHRILSNGPLDPRWRHPDYDGFYRFAVLRNPYDRFISGWRYCVSTRRRPLRDVLRHLPARNALDHVLGPDRSWRARYYNGLILLDLLGARLKYHALAAAGRRPAKWPQGLHDFYHLTCPQWEMLLEPDGRLGVDRLVFFERLDEGMDEVFADLGRPRPDLPRLRATTRREDYRTAFDDETRAMFETAYARELDLWRYDFDTGAPPIDRASITDLSDLDRR